MPGRGEVTALLRLPGVAHSGADPPSWKYTPMPRAAAPRTIASYGAHPLSGYAAGSFAVKFGLGWVVASGGGRAGGLPVEIRLGLASRVGRDAAPAHAHLDDVHAQAPDLVEAGITL